MGAAGLGRQFLGCRAEGILGAPGTASTSASRPPKDKDLFLSDCFEPGNRFNAQLGAVITYANGAEAEKMTTREYALYHDSNQNKRIERGYGTLITAYAAGLDVRLDCPVTLIDHSGKLLRIVTPRGELLARAAIAAPPPGVIANEMLRFSPALPAKLDAAANLPLGVADSFPRIDDPQDLPIDTRVVGSRSTRATGSYTLRAFGRPVIEGYFGGAFRHRSKARSRRSRSSRSAARSATTSPSASP